MNYLGGRALRRLRASSGQFVLVGDVLLQLRVHWQLGILLTEWDEQNILVDGMVVLGSAALGRGLACDRRVDVVIADT